jgi:hypothetical protein
METFARTIMDVERAIRGCRPPRAVPANFMSRRDLLGRQAKGRS